MIEKFEDEKLILEELHRDEKKINEDEWKIKIAFFGIAILFLTVIIGAFYFLLRLDTSSKSANIAIQVTPIPSAPASRTTEIATLVTPTPIVVVKEVIKEVSVKDQYIPFGSGTNQTSDWADVPGLQADIDFGSYSIKDVRFEVSVNIPTANQTASVRLFNVTDKHPVWNSEVTITNNVYTVSPSLIYDRGLKTYQVQMKTQLKFLANLTLARIHIYLQ